MGPDFIIIGAMKCATSSLHEQLAQQPGFFMSDPKEPNYFSDDAQWARGSDYYAGLFADAGSAQLRGESSTHYTKLPTHPRSCSRMREMLPNLKLIYMMRHPVERLVSHYIHEWTQRVIDRPIDLAIEAHPELVAYGQYAMQLAPYIEAYGKASILPVFQERFKQSPQDELQRICDFLGYDGVPEYRVDVAPSNVSSERLRLGPAMRMIVENGLLAQARRRLVPRRVRDLIKGQLQMRERPELSADSRAFLVSVFDRDLAVLGEMLGVDISCDTFKSVATARPYLLV